MNDQVLAVAESFPMPTCPDLSALAQMFWKELLENGNQTVGVAPILPDVGEIISGW
ncbi:MAG: hypothetical protein NVS2B7_29840 [Herpetosiphon sp.]